MEKKQPAPITHNITIIVKQNNKKWTDEEILEGLSDKINELFSTNPDFMPVYKDAKDNNRLIFAPKPGDEAIRSRREWFKVGNLCI